MTFKRAFLLLVFGGAAVLSADDRIDKLDPVHKKWFEEEVTYIITDQEKEVFLSLPAVRESRLSIRQTFGSGGDPDPASPENEFKKEHYERLDYANRIFSRDAPRPGWKTDMGRFWIILGKPHESSASTG